MVQLDNGLDEHGYIRNVYSPSHIQAEFKAVVDAAVNELTTKFPNQIDGIYLYGSIGRGNAVLGKSDLDLSIVLKHPQSDTQRQTFKVMVRDFPRCNAQVSKIDLDIGHVNEVLQVDEYYRWQFWLKHCCCCVWGNVLRPVFGIILIMLRSLEESMMWRLVIQYHLTMRSTFLSGLAIFLNHKWMP